MHVARALHGRGSSDWGVTGLPTTGHPPRIFALTIADMGDFEAETYQVKLDAWCKATIDAWNVGKRNGIHRGT
jgi:hypothetical protein